MKKAPKSKINCIKCGKLLKTSNDKLVCSKCENTLNLKCSRLSPKEFSKHKKGKTKCICQFCTDYTCIKCDRHVEYDQKGVLCTGFCNLWIHKKFKGNTKADYQNIGSNKEEAWCCRHCKVNMFPFYGLIINSIILQVLKYLEQKQKTQKTKQKHYIPVILIAQFVLKNALKKN